MNKLPHAKRIQILNLLCEGSSLRAISRVVDVSINTVTKMLVDAGEACAAHHDQHVRDVKAKRIQCDLVLLLRQAKEREGRQGGPGRRWGRLDLDRLEAESKLMVSYLVGGRDSEYAWALMDDLRTRLANRVQLTTDGHKAYLNAVEDAFGDDVDYAMLVKLYGEAPEGQRRYSPAHCVGARKEAITGRPGACQHQLRRAVQPDHADAHASLHPPDQCLLQEGREPRPRRGAARHVL